VTLRIDIPVSAAVQIVQAPTLDCERLVIATPKEAKKTAAIAGRVHLVLFGLAVFLNLKKLMINLCELCKDAFCTGATTRDVVVGIVGINDQ